MYSGKVCFAAADSCARRDTVRSLQRRLNGSATHNLTRQLQAADEVVTEATERAERYEAGRAPHLERMLAASWADLAAPFERSL